MGRVGPQRHRKKKLTSKKFSSIRLGSRQQENRHTTSAQCVHFRQLWGCGREGGHKFVTCSLLGVHGVETTPPPHPTVATFNVKIFLNSVYELTLKTTGFHCYST